MPVAKFQSGDPAPMTDSFLAIYSALSVKWQKVTSTDHYDFYSHPCHSCEYSYCHIPQFKPEPL